MTCLMATPSYRETATSAKASGSMPVIKACAYVSINAAEKADPWHEVNGVLIATIFLRSLETACGQNPIIVLRKLKAGSRPESREAKVPSSLVGVWSPRNAVTWNE